MSRRLLKRPTSGPRRASTSCENSRPVADPTSSYPGVSMRIRRLARNAAFMAVAATVMGGFLTGIAGATSVAPTSTVSVVAPGGTIPRMPGSCTPQPAFCTYASAKTGLVLLQKFGCARNVGHTALSGSIIFEMVNGCATRVYYYHPAGGHGCISHNTIQAGVNRFGNVDYYFVDIVATC